MSNLRNYSLTQIKLYIYLYVYVYLHQAGDNLIDLSLLLIIVWMCESTIKVLKMLRKYHVFG